MKKVLILISVLQLVVFTCMANTSVSLSFADSYLSVDALPGEFKLLLPCQQTTFELYNKRTDELGIEHLSFRQRFSGTLINSALVLVHAKGGNVLSINGSYVPDSELPINQKISISKSVAQRKVSKKVNPKFDADVVLVTDPQTKAIRFAYKVFSIETQENVFVDAETGEIICRVSLCSNYDVNATAYTKYKGKQSFICDYDEGYGGYRLVDNSRSIVTLNASQIDPSDFYTALGNTDVSEEEYISNVSNAMLSVLANSCSHLASLTSEWSIYQLTSVSVTQMKNSTWFAPGLELEDKADIFIKVYDPMGNLIYKSGYYEDCSTPVSFNLKNSDVYMPMSGYKIYVYDYDPLSDDDLADIISIDELGSGTYTWDATNTKGSITIKESPAPYTDAHWGMQKTYDFYKNVLNRASYDNNGSPIYQLFAPPHDDNLFSTMPNNAIAIPWVGTPLEGYGCEFMAYGRGDDEKMTHVVALDVMAHEYTHLVTAYNGNSGLDYIGESGALNEGFSDIFAHCVEQYVNINSNWLIGEGVMVNCSNMRDMSNPNNGMDGSGPQPDTYGGRYWQNPDDVSSDYGGVHTNSGVLNFWFYLLCEGRQGMNDFNCVYDVTGIGIEKAQKIAYRMLIYYMAPDASFEDAREASKLATIDLYGDNSSELESVEVAWDAVGVGGKFVLTPGKYVIIANRDKENDENWYYMTADVGTASTKRFQAVNSGTPDINDVAVSNLDSKYVWELQSEGDNWKLKNGSSYVTWTADNSAKLGSTAKILTFDAYENQAQIHFYDGSDERYLSLHNDNNYFAFYRGTAQVSYLYLLPYEEVSSECSGKNIPFLETFSASQGEFVEQTVTMPAGASKMWNYTAQYGMKISGRVNGTDRECESWLISPCISLQNAIKPQLTFDHAHKFASTPINELTLWISDDYESGLPSTATWNQLTIPTYSTNNDWNFVSSSAIDLSTYNGKCVSLAWRYVSNTTHAATWELKNVLVQEMMTPTKAPQINKEVIVLGNSTEITVLGAEVGELIEIYTVTGLRVYQVETELDVCTFPVQNGCYVVKIGTELYKVVVK